MRVFAELRLAVRRFTANQEGNFATEYGHMIVYLAIAVALGMVILGDNFDNFLSNLRRSLFGSAIG